MGGPYPVTAEAAGLQRRLHPLLVSGEHLQDAGGEPRNWRGTPKLGGTPKLQRVPKKGPLKLGGPQIAKDQRNRVRLKWGDPKIGTCQEGEGG